MWRGGQTARATNYRAYVERRVRLYLLRLLLETVNPEGDTMSIDFRKVARYVLNIVAVIVGALTLPSLGAVVPEAWLPAIGTVVGVLNMILSVVRSVGAGEPLLKSF
jgi:hypothetical protein